MVTKLSHHHIRILRKILRYVKKKSIKIRSELSILWCFKVAYIFSALPSPYGSSHSMFGSSFTLVVVWYAHPPEEPSSILSSPGLTCLLYFHTSSCCHSNPTPPSPTTCSASNTSVRYSASSDFSVCPNTLGDFE